MWNYGCTKTKLVAENTLEWMDFIHDDLFIWPAQQLSLGNAVKEKGNNWNL